MAFASQEDVFAVWREVLPPVFEKYGTYKTASKAPFAASPYHDAMDKYGSDKPDLRIDLVVQDATECMADCGFRSLRGSDVKASRCDGFKATRKSSTSICADVEVQTGNKAYWFRVDENGELVGGISKFFRSARTGHQGTGPEDRRFCRVCRRQEAGSSEDSRRLRKLLGASGERTYEEGLLRVLLDRRLPDVRDRRGVRRAGILPQSVLHAPGRYGCTEQSGSSGDLRIPVRSGLQRRRAVLRCSA